jgi:hypothetical protein
VSQPVNVNNNIFPFNFVHILFRLVRKFRLGKVEKAWSGWAEVSTCRFERKEKGWFILLLTNLPIP